MNREGVSKRLLGYMPFGEPELVPTACRTRRVQPHQVVSHSSSPEPEPDDAGYETFTSCFVHLHISQPMSHNVVRCWTKLAAQANEVKDRCPENL